MRNKMQALVLVAAREVRMEEREKPIPEKDEVLIRVRACGICGSDMEGYIGKSDKRVPPLIMGHEFAGEVVQSNLGEPDDLAGRRVVVQPLLGCGECEDCIQGHPGRCPSRELIGIHRPGGLAEYAAVPRKAVYPLPREMDYVTASLVEPLAISVRAFHQNLRGLVKSVAIFGAGTQGLLALQMARMIGAETIVSDVNQLRLQQAKTLGATEVIPAHQQAVVQCIREFTAGRGVDMAIEAAGRAITRRQSLATLKPGGTAVFIGLGTEDAETSLPCLDVVNRELRIIGSYAYSDFEFLHAMDLLRREIIQQVGWVSKIPMIQGPKAFEELVQGKSRAAKIVLLP